MRDPKRIPEILQVLGEIWTKYPDLRLGQIIDNASVESQSKAPVFYIEDDDLLEGLKSLNQKISG